MQKYARLRCLHGDGLLNGRCQLKYSYGNNRIVRNDLKEEQNIIAQQYKSNPKKFWKYVNSKTKRTERIGDLKVKMSKMKQ